MIQTSENHFIDYTKNEKLKSIFLLIIKINTEILTIRIFKNFKFKTIKIYLINEKSFSAYL